MQPPQGRRRTGTQLGGQDLSQLLERGQGLRRSTGRQQRSHVQLAQPFPQRMCGHQLGQLGDPAGSVTTGQLAFNELLDGA